jgi:hypothetical protein
MNDIPSITLAYGDSGAPAFMEAALRVLREAGARLQCEAVELGARIHAMQHPEGILPGAFATLARSRCLLKAYTAPPGEGNQPPTQAVLAHFGMQGQPPAIQRQPFGAAEACVSVWIGESFALFEATANNVESVLLAACGMLHHLGQPAPAELILQAMARVAQQPLAAPNLIEKLCGSGRDALTAYTEALDTHIQALS